MSATPGRVDRDVAAYDEPSPDYQDELVAALADRQRRANGIPDAALAADRRRCQELLTGVLGPWLLDEPAGSVLGEEWTELYTAVVRSGADHTVLRAAGWLPLDPAGTHWAVVADRRVLGTVRLLPAADARAQLQNPAATVLLRCQARGQVRLCDVLELRALRRQGAPLPPSSRELTAAADVEAGLGGRQLAPWATGRPAVPPVPLPRKVRRRLVVAVSGVDGSGKTTLRARLVDQLERCGLPTSTVWVRPGMGLGPLVRLATVTKRLLGVDAAPGIRLVAEGTGNTPRSRQGLVGWVWALLVTMSFVVGVRRQHRCAHGVVVYDRHLVDALTTLDVVYAGVNLRLHHALMRALVPRAAVRIHLDVPAAASVARKPDDLIGESAVLRQLDAYRRWHEVLPPTLVLDGTRAPEDVALQAITEVLTALVGQRSAS